ncbi:HlyD family type I secretion periplasmic adaptor subunit [Fuscibacter oryzae]|uniref:Membrane fusion protein (MFP) family protein n=1 Tax=Fuscibacter oryzae TaxID=2803939 RepID=A0A8J7MT79_9RHOB|nr:HlyD family type I secretion periplasmic adaptor subunit [Fuscibacter oryzae]MBL4929141.1 HlyD family type I secretion periplasmic adaptor subunit [Fuscibacter oryzae]
MTSLSARRPALVGLATLAILILGLGLWASLARIDGAVVVAGRIEVERNRQIVQHPDGGLVAAVMVAEGESVVSGQILIRLDGAQVSSNLRAAQAQLQSLRAGRARLLAERDGTPAPAFPPDLQGSALADEQLALFSARQDMITHQIAQLRQRLDQIAAQTTGIRAQETSLARQITLTEQDLATQRDLRDKGLTQSARVSALDRQLAQLQGDLGEARAGRAQAEGRATEVRLEILRLADERRTEAADALRDQTPREAELAERCVSLAAQLARLTLRAPVSGTVLGLQITGQQAVIGAGQTVLAIVPQDRPLIATLRIAPTDIDQVAPGQPVRLILTALPGRSTPEIMGSLLTISPDILTDPDSHVGYYRAEVAIPPGQTDRLVPGMPVQALVETGARSALAYLTRPLTDYFRLAFRES